MSAKPATIARWALDSTYTTDAANVVPPGSGMQDTGYPHGADPLSGIDNWRAGIAARWQKYLSDGAFSGASSFDSTLGVTGVVTFASNANVGGNLAVTGNAAVGGNVVITGSLTTTGLVKRGPLWRPLAWAMTLQLDIQNNYISSTDNYIPIVLTEGERLLQVRTRVRCSTTDTVALKVVKADMTGASQSKSQLGSTANSTGHALAGETVLVSGLTELYAGGLFTYAAHLVITVTANVELEGAWVQTDVP